MASKKKEPLLQQAETCVKIAERQAYSAHKRYYKHNTVRTLETYHAALTLLTLAQQHLDDVKKQPADIAAINAAMEVQK